MKELCPPCSTAPQPACLCARSIRFSLLPEEEQAAALSGSSAGPAGAPLPSAQLRSRYWRIRDAAGRVVNEVRGEAVVGHYPLLRPGEPLAGGGADWGPASVGLCSAACHRFVYLLRPWLLPHQRWPCPALRCAACRRTGVCVPVVHAPARAQGVHGRLLLLCGGLAAGEALPTCAGGCLPAIGRVARCPAQGACTDGQSRLCEACLHAS